MRAGICLAFTMVVTLAPPALPQARGCSTPSVDSVYLLAGPVYRDCDVTRSAQLRHEERFISVNLPRRGCMRAEVEFVVDSTGQPEMATARIVFTDALEFSQELMRVVPFFRYRPAERDGIPVRQLVRERRSAVMSAEVMSPAEGQPGPPVPRRSPAVCR